MMLGGHFKLHHLWLSQIPPRPPPPATKLGDFALTYFRNFGAIESHNWLGPILFDLSLNFRKFSFLQV